MSSMSMKKQFRIYLEGGGDGKKGKDALRRAMDDFLKPLKDKARQNGCAWTLVCCGGRRSAWDKFQNAVRNYPHETAILLVDSETAVAYPADPFPSDGPKQHLKNRAGDGWDTDACPTNHIHLMVQSMETWLVADPDGLAAFYGQGFNTKVLPNRLHLEQEAKAHVYAKLDAAARQTPKGLYSEDKLTHSSKILPKVDSTKVRARCPHAEHFFTTLESLISH